MVKLLLLDFDGTLADTRRANALGYIDALAEEGFRLDEATYLKNYFGMRCDEFLSQLGFRSAEDRQRIRQRKIELYPAHFDTVRLNEPLMNFVRTFRRSGGQAYVVSTGHIDNITNAMNHLGIRHEFDRIISGDDVDQPKPHPECFLKAMEMAGASPDQTLIFEDSNVGIEAAKASNAGVIRITMQDF